MLDYVGCENKIEPLFREWERANIARVDFAKPLFGAIPDRFGTLVDPSHSGKAQVVKQPEIAARAGANVQNFYIRRKIEGFYDIREQQPSTNEPPMIRFDGRLDGVAGNVHLCAMTKVNR
jgi:hypothetical protein